MQPTQMRLIKKRVDMIMVSTNGVGGTTKNISRGPNCVLKIKLMVYVIPKLVIPILNSINSSCYLCGSNFYNIMALLFDFCICVGVDIIPLVLSHNL